VIHESYRLYLTAARLGQYAACQVRDSEREEQAVKVRFEGASEDPVRGELVPLRRA
jgi:hypothetical protein